MKHPEIWLPVHALDRALALPKGSAFRAFKTLRAELHEGRDYRVLSAGDDAAALARLRQSGMIYPNSINVVMLSPQASTRLCAMLRDR